MNYSWFSNTAKSEGRTGFGWGLIGSLIYIVPARLFQEFIFPSLVRGSVTSETVAKFTLVSWLLAVIIGVLSALLTQSFFASRVIRRKSATDQ